MRPKLMIIGHACHGKDTVGELLKNLYGYQFTSSSWFCAERVMLPAFEKARLAQVSRFEEVPNYHGDVQRCFDDRSRFRAFWYGAIRDYCNPDKARLAREIFAENDCYVGIRQVREFMSARNENLFNFSIWVDASERIQPEDAGSMRMQPWMCDYWLDNNSSLEDLRRNLVTLMDTIIMPEQGAILKERLRVLSMDEVREACGTYPPDLRKQGPGRSL